MNDFAPFILIYIPEAEHQFTSTVFVSEMGVMVTFHFSFHFNVLFCAFPFFLPTSKGSLPTDVLYNTSEAAFQHQPSATEHTLQRAELLFFLSSIICVSIHLDAHQQHS